MADRVAQQAYDAGSAAPADATWRDRVVTQAVTLRQAVLRHPDGAILLAGSPRSLSTCVLALMERRLRTLREAGVSTAHCGVAADTVLSHLTGFVLQE